MGKERSSLYPNSSENTGQLGHFSGCMRRQRIVGELSYYDDKGNCIKLHMSVLIVRAGKYWWARIFFAGGHRKGQWELQNPEVIQLLLANARPCASQ